jgi:hypothetical protein
MGVISDRTHTRWGRRRPYMFVGAILMAVTFVFLFNVPEFESGRATFFYVMIVFTLSATAYTIFCRAVRGHARRDEHGPARTHQDHDLAHGVHDARDPARVRFRRPR